MSWQKNRSISILFNGFRPPSDNCNCMQTKKMLLKTFSCSLLYFSSDKNKSNRILLTWRINICIFGLDFVLSLLKTLGPDTRSELPKGQLISKCPFGFFKATKKLTKFYKDFCPSLKDFQIWPQTSSKKTKLQKQTYILISWGIFILDFYEHYRHEFPISVLTWVQSVFFLIVHRRKPILGGIQYPIFAPI